MPLDSLGLGLTLDTTLLEKADKTLENMHKNSKLIMQNLTRGISAFNSGAITDFADVLNNVQEALSKMDGTKMSIDYDKKGLEEYKRGINDILDLTVRLSEKFGDMKFYDPKRVNRTDESPYEVRKRLNELLEEYKTFEAKLNKADEFDADSDKYTKQLTDSKAEIEKLTPSVEKLKEAYEKAKDAYQKYVDTQSKKIREKTPEATDEEIHNVLLSRDAYIKKATAMLEAQKAYKEEESLLKAQQKLYGDASAAKFFSENRQELEENSAMLRESIKNAAADLAWANKTIAEKDEELLKDQKARDNEEKSRIAGIQSTYKEIRKAIEQGEKELAEAEKRRDTIAKGKGDTSEYDAKIQELKAFLDEKKDIETSWRKSQYWPALEAIDKQFNKKKLEDEYKQRISSPTVAFANQYSKNATSIDEETQAVKMLEAARDSLSNSTAHYDQVVNALNKRIAKHEDHIKLLTQEQKESKELQDSVISRYIREKKEIKELNKVLKELHEKQASTGIKTAEEDKYEQDIIARRQRLWNDVHQIEVDNAKQITQLKEKYDASVAEEKIQEIIKTNEKEKQEYAKLLDDLYALEKQKKSMEDAGGGVGDVAYDKLLQQEADLQARKAQLESQHQNDLDEIRKKHDKRRNDDEVKAFIDAQKEKQRIAEEYAKKQREKAKKYGTISNASAERLIGVADKAQNVNQHKLAIEKLTQARNSLNTTDKDYLKTVKKLNDAIKYHEIEIELVEDKSKKLMQTHRGLMDIGGQLMRRLALAFSVSQLTQYFRKLVEVRGEFEKTEVALTTILKSRAQANVLMNQITDLAVKSPFTLQQLVGYTKQLAAYQIEYKKLYSTTKMLADVSAGLGVEMDRLILAFGQVRAANFLRATEVRQFTEAGFDILGELAKHYSTLKGEMVSVAEVQEMVTKRMVGFADVEKVFQNVTSAGGIFYDMQAKQAETLAGQWSNLQDKISIMYNEIGKSTDGMLKGIVSFLASLIDNWEGAATVLKGVVTAFAMVKINAALTNKETIKFVRSMGLIKGRVKAVSVIKLLGAAFVQLWRSIKAAGAALKAFAVNNPYIAAIAALVGVIGAVVSKHRKQENAVKEVVKRYDQLHESITDVNGAMLNAINEQDLDKQKDALKELVDMVDKEYNMKINIDIEELSPEEVASKFNEIMDEAEKLNIFGELFGSGLEGFKAEGQNALKDISQYGEAANDLFKQMVDKSNMVASALQEIDADKYKDIIKDLVTPRDRKGGESELAYLNRLYEAYMKIKEESSIDLSWDDDTEQYIARTSENFYELGRILGEIDFNSLSLDYANALKEFKDVEFVEYLDTLTDSLEGLTDEQKEKKLKFAIDTEAAHREWNAFVVQLMYEIANKKFGLNIRPKIEAPEEVEWKKWQENYKKKFEKEEGYMRITSPSITQEAQIKALNEEYAKQYDLLERIKKAGGQSALEVGGAYEGLGKTMGEIAAEMEDVNAQIEYLGGKNTTIDKNEKASQKILNRRISILKEIHEAYKQARKDDLGHDEAIKKVMKDWGDTFKEAFEGTSMSLTRLFVDKDKLTELQDSGKESGKVFSDAMLEEMNKMAEDGTYIRKASDKFKEKLKRDEGLRLQLYDDKTGEVIKNATDWANKAGTATIGWGHAVTSLAEATKYFGKTLTEAEAQSLFDADVASKQEELNVVLDAYKELIVTQGQYDALLNRTFQGGGGMTEAAIKYATNTEAAIKHFEILDTKLQKHGMTFAEEFGEDFVEKFKETETVAERLALVLKTIGLTTKASGSQIDPDLYGGMKKRAEERAAEFTGDLEIVKLLEKASQTIADFDFSTPEGLVKAMRGLMPIAKKEGKEAMLALSKEISKVENEVGVKIRLEKVDEFKTDVEKTLGDYKLWKDIEKLQMPDDVASKIFGVTPKTLQQVREEVLNALNLGDDINLGNEEDVLAAVKLQYGDPTEEVVRNFFKNVNQIQRSETEEQAKRFVKFLTKNLDQTKVIMSQRGVDIAFAKESFDKGAISAEQFAETVKNIIAQSNEEISKFNLDKFKETPEYIQAMGNLTAYSITELEGLKTKLQELISANGEAFSAEEMLVYQRVLEKIGERIDLLDDNLWFKDSDIKTLQEIKRIEGEITDEKKKEADATANLTNLEAKRAELVATLSALEKRREDAIASGDSTEAIDGQILDITSQITSKNEEILQVQGTIKKSKTLLSELGEEMDRILDGQTKAMAKVEAGLNIFNKSLSLVADTYQDIKEVADSFGVDTESLGWKQTENVMGMLQGFGSSAASAAGKFATGDIFGGVMDSLKAIKELIVGINKMHDDALEDTIQDHLEEVETLQKEYEKLEWVIGRALAFDKYGMVAEQTKNIGKQIENTSKAIALEEDKKDTDEERIKELRENAEAARRQIQELYDNLREEIVGSYEDLSSTLADAMIEALKSGEDALKAWSDSVDEIIENIVTKLAVQKYVEPQVSKVLDQFYNKTMPKNAAAEKAFNRLQNMTAGTEAYNRALAQYEKLNEQAIGELPKITEESLNALKASLDAIGVSFEPIAEQIVGLFGQEGGLSGLQKGIQGITEDTAQVIESYLNSIRGYVSEQVTHTKNIYRILNDAVHSDAAAIRVRMV